MIVKLLIVYHVNAKLADSKGQTALDVARLSKARHACSCASAIEEISLSQEKAEREISNDFHPSPAPQDTTFLLSMDGGGSRSVTTCQMVIAIANRMKQLKPDCLPLQCYFDYMAGTSGGAILALGLSHASATPELSCTACVRCSLDVCNTTPPFPGEVMDTYLKECFGPNIKMKDVGKPRVIITAVKAETTPPQLHLFRNYGNSKDIERKVWECARASSAAPVYFTPFEEHYIDGGVMANNPTLDAMVEIFAQSEKEEQDVKIGLVVSLGTGIVPPAIGKSTQVYIPKLGGILESIIKLPSTIAGLSNLLEVFISQSTQSEGEEVRKAKTWCKSIGASYYRLSPQFDKDYDMAISEEDVLIDIMYEAHTYILENSKQIDEVARMLLSRGPRT